MSGSRTIYVTGGRKDYARATLTDDLGHDLSTATIRLGLSTSKTTQPSQWYAPDIATFNRLLQSLDAGIIAYHLERGDFSRWITGVLRDRHLAATASAIERDVLTRRAADILHARERLGDAIDARYRDVAD